MIKALKNELFKLFTSKKIYILSFILGFLAFLVSLYMKKAAAASSEGLARLNPQSFPADFMLQIGTAFMPILIIVVASGLFSDEYRDETMKVNLLAPVSRVEFLFSKILTIVIGVLFLLTSTLVFSYLAAAIFQGFRGNFIYKDVSLGTMEGILRTLGAYYIGAIPLSAFAMVVLLFSELLESSGSVVGLGIGLYMIETVLHNISPQLSVFMITAHFNIGEFVILGNGYRDILQMAALSIIYIVVSILIMIVNFVRKDI